MTTIIAAVIVAIPLCMGLHFICEALHGIANILNDIDNQLRRHVP